MQPETTNLFKTEGSSDKVYNVELKELDGAWAVHAFNGRRGKALKLQNKGEGLAYEAAKNIFDKLVKSKMKGGYTESEDGVSYTGTGLEGRKTNFRAQLLNEVTLREAMDYGDDWLYQQKHDGERRGFAWEGDKAVFANRTGLSVPVSKVVSDAVQVLAEDLGSDFEIDAEDMSTRLEIVDLIAYPGLPEGATFGQRAVALGELRDTVERLGLSDVLSVNVPLAAGAFWSRISQLHEANAEGFVLRHKDSVYAAGRPNQGGDALKVKFWKDVTCRVGPSREGKRSVGLELLDDAGEWTAVGNVTIPANADIPEQGSLIDVKYLYAYKGGSIFQPTFLRPRTDVLEQECRMDRLTYRSEDKSVFQDVPSEPSLSL